MDVLQAIVVALIAAATSLITFWGTSKLRDSQAKRESATAADSLTDSALSLLQPYKDENMAMKEQIRTLTCKVSEQQGEIDMLSKRLRQLEIALDDVVAGAHKLVHQVKSRGDVPVYDPPERRAEGDAEKG